MEAEEDDKKEVADDESHIVRNWLVKLKKADKRHEKWARRAKEVVKRYRDERDSSVDRKKFNILWSNVETLKPALYARLPQPVVTRRHKDKDPVGLKASEVLERALVYSLDDYNMDDVIRSVVEDLLLPGCGMSRVYYEAEFAEMEMGEAPEIETGAGDEGGTEEESIEQVVDEKAVAKYLFWEDIRYGKARCWEEVPWVAFGTPMTRAQLVERFGEELGKAVELNYHSDDQEDEDKAEADQAYVYEIWDKNNGDVIWITKGYKDAPLDRSDPPLNLDGFYPCPKPLMASTTNDKMEPIPDFCQYQDQADEIDTLTSRIEGLTESLKLVGVYAGDEKSNISNLMNQNDSTLVPVDNWAMYAEKGGLKGMIEWAPIAEISQVIKNLYDIRERTKQELYEITGIADIIRGASKANETATAQRIKGQFATLRLDYRQNMVATYIRDMIRLQAEVICENYSLDTLMEISGITLPRRQEKMLAQLEIRQAMMTGNQEMAQQVQAKNKAILEQPAWEDVYDLLRNDKLRGFRIDIETDSTIKMDEDAEKQARIEFLQAVGTFMNQALPTAQQAPELGDVLGQMLMFGIRGFRAGRDLEQAMEDALEKLKNRPPPDPSQNIEAQRLQGDQAAKVKELQQKDHELAQKDRELQIKEYEVGLGKMQEGIEQAASVGESATGALASIQEAVTANTMATNQVLTQQAEVLQNLAIAVTQMAQNLGAPKMIVRDSEGRPIGVETVSETIQ